MIQETYLGHPMKIRLFLFRVVWLGIFLIMLSTQFDKQTIQAAGSQTQLDPIGKYHIPIGIPNSLDSLKTFVAAEGNFSPGVGSYGIYFWVFEPGRKRLTAPTFKHVPCIHGLAEKRLIIPWS